MKKLLFLFISLLVSVVLGGQAYSACEVAVGWEPWEPYQLKDNTGNYSGLDIDIVKAAFETSDCTLEFKEMPWKRVLLSIKEGAIQIGMGASQLPEREPFSYFSLPYRDESFTLFIEKGGNEKYKLVQLDDVIKYDLHLGTVRGYFYGRQFEDALKNPKFKVLIEEVTDDETNLKKFEKGRIKAFFMDPYMATDLLRKQNMLNKVERSHITLVTGTIHFMLSKKSATPEMLKRLNEGLQRIKTNGILEKINQKYLK
ncbi:MAG: amino acid ABC transporter substrate-binding protein [SAR324 cluster bacterium]|nr:amino acid ABC transporter substrate-binding protein [SAR324 cluster bacterium]